MSGRIIEPGKPIMLTLNEYVQASGSSVSTVRRAWREGRLPGAVKQQTGRKDLLIPADCEMLPPGSPLAVIPDEVQTAASTGVETGVMTTAEPTSQQEVVSAAAALPVNHLLLVALGLTGQRPTHAAPLLVPLEEMAAVYNTSTGGIERLGEAGHLQIGKFGRGGKKAVVLPPIAPAAAPPPEH